MEEPSLLDYIKAKLTPWRGPAPQIPKAPEAEPKAIDLEKPAEMETAEQEGLVLGSSAPAEEAAQTFVEFNLDQGSGEAGGLAATPAGLPEARAASQTQAASRAVTIPWRSLVAIGLALFAQATLEPDAGRVWQTAAIIYITAFGFLIWAYWTGEWQLLPGPQEERRTDPYTVRVTLALGIVSGLLAYWMFSGNLFTTFNVFFWLWAIFFVVQSLWLSNSGTRAWTERIKTILRSPRWSIVFSRWTLLVLAISAVVIFFRVYRLNLVPAEMVSDQAEKLLDVIDVLNGQTHIFFPRNTGREAIQFYLTAGIINLLGTGISYISLKIGTALIGLITLPFMYLLGKEVANRRVGLLAMAFAGIAYWPNVISRVGLRFPLYAAFVAPTFYFLFRGIRRSNRNDYILAGLSLGLGLHGYTPIRILPFVVVAAVVLYLIHKQSAGVRRQTIWGLFLLTAVSLVVFLPLMRYASENPEMFSFRALSRLGTVERPLPGPAWQIFLSNLWNGMTMYGWDDGDIWTISVPHRPALDFISAALFHLGMVLLLVRYIRRRNWLDLFLLLSVPLLMLPSILSLAYPTENPALNRAAGAMVPVFLIVGITLDSFLSTLRTRLGEVQGPWITAAVGVLLFLWAANKNYDLVFNQFANSYDSGAWNTSEMGQVVHEFADSMGSYDTAWVVGYPFWVDTRLVGINAGNPKDYAIAPDQLAGTGSVAGAKLFLINLQDKDSVQALKNLYPAGWMKEYVSKYPNKDFLVFFVPPAQ